MKLNFKINFFLLLLAVLISVALMFAFVEIPTLIDNFLQKSNRFPAGDYGSITSDSFEMRYYVRGMGLRWIGYGSLAIILALIVTGFVTRKSGFVWTGALAMYLPVFGGFAMSMFFLSGLGILKAGWIPFFELSENFMHLGKVIFVPYWILMWIFRQFGFYAHQLLAWFFMGVGSGLFTWGVLVWFQTRFGQKGVATQLIYKFSRHPQYLGWIIWSYGLLLFSLTVNQMKKSWGTEASLPWLLSTMIIIGICFLEEQKMAEIQGEQYLEYRKRTPFLFPLPKWLSRILLYPSKLFFENDFPGRKREIVGLTLFYTLSLIGLSMFFTERNMSKTYNHISKKNSQILIDSLVVEIKSAKSSRNINQPFEMLMQFGDRASESILLMLNDSSEIARNYSVQYLGELKCEEAVIPLLGLLNHSSEKTRLAAITALGKIGDDFAVDPLLCLLKNNPSEKMIPWLIDALGNIGSEKSWEPVLNYSTHDFWFTRVNVVKALNNINREKSWIYIYAFLEDEHPQVRLNAVKLILQFQPKNAEESLQKVLKDENYEVRFFARQALKQIQNKK
jgi:protein-S-isoprenylcysteine O-methyltransferase Ste14